MWAHLSQKRRRQCAALVLLMLFGAAAELMTLGAVIPFLALMVDPTKADSFPLIGNLANAFNWHGDKLVILASFLFMSCAIAAAAIRLVLLWASQRFVHGTGHDLAVAVYNRTLHQPYHWHVNKNSSEILAAVGKVQAIVHGLLSPLMMAVIASVLATFILVGLFLVDATIALATGTMFVSLYTGMSLIVRSRIRVNGNTIAGVQRTRIQALQEGLGGIRDVILDQTQKLYVARFGIEDYAMKRAQAANHFLVGAPTLILQSIAVVLMVLLALYLSSQPAGLAAALPTLGAIALGGQKLLPLVQQIYHGWLKVVAHHAMLKDTLDFLDLTTDEGKSPIRLKYEKHIRLNHVGYSYSGADVEALSAVTLDIKRGESVGFVGKTGSGKSTLLDLIMGLLEPSSGEISIDGIPLTTENHVAWQKNIAHVPQSIFLSDTTIRENVALGTNPDSIDDGTVGKAIRQACLEDFIASLPKGIHTRVGERGVRLSGGQRQRIGIARALYKQCSVLILDEATSALDDETESAIVESIKKLDGDLTILAIAHRRSTLTSCDSIYELKQGCLSKLPHHKKSM